MDQAPPTIRKQCAATRRDGQRCQAPALPDSEHCFAHAEHLAANRQAAREKGGRHKASVVRLRGLMPPRLVPVFETLEAALGEVHAGTLDPKRAQAMASLARAMVAVMTAGELEERMREVETQLRDRGSAWPA